MDTGTLATESAPPALVRARGGSRLRFTAEAGSTRLAHRDQRAPARILTPRDHGTGLAGATLVNEAGGLTGGDRLDQAVAAESGAAAVVTGQAAEKIYRTTGPATAMATQLDVADGAWLEWLPQETILFDGAHLRRSTSVAVAGGGRLLAGELLALGRHARGESVGGARLRDTWRVRVDGRLVWADGLALTPPNAALAEPAGFAGYAATATLVYVDPDADRWHACANEVLAARTGDRARAGVTLVDGLLLVRVLALDGAALRDVVGGFWADFRQAVAGLPARLPAAWHT